MGGELEVCKQVENGVRRGAILEMWKGSEGYMRAGGMMRKGEIAVIWGTVGMRWGWRMRSRVGLGEVWGEVKSRYSCRGGKGVLE